MATHYLAVSGEKGTIVFTCKQHFLENVTYTEFRRFCDSREGKQRIKVLEEIVVQILLCLMTEVLKLKLTQSSV